MSSARFAEFVSDLQYDRIPPEVVEKSKQCVLDSIGVATNGALSESGRVISGVARRQFAKGAASVVVSGDRLSATGCAFANSTMAMYMSLDDVDRLALSHFGSSVIWAALAAGAEAAANGKSVIEAIVGGYDVAARTGALFDPVLRGKGIRTTALVNCLGAAMAAGKAMGLDKEDLTNAINLAATCPSFGLLQYWSYEGDELTQQLHGGMAARQGVLCAALASEGVVAPSHGLEGDKGLIRAMLGRDDGADPTEGLGSWFGIMRTGFKPFAGCGQLHPIITATIELERNHRLDSDQIESGEILILDHATTRGCNKPKVTNVSEACLSIQYAAASTLVNGNALFTEEDVTSPRVQRLMDKLSVIEDKEFTELFPKKWPAEVRVKMKDGSKYEARIDYPLGQPENPISFEMLSEKFRGFASRAYAPASVSEMIDTVKHMDSEPDMAQLMNLIAHSSKTMT